MAKTERAIFEDHDAALEAAADAEGLADLEAGRIVDNDSMKAWLQSWGKPGELPPPRKGD